MSNTPCLQPLHPIETASLDELQALQLSRLKSSLRGYCLVTPHFAPERMLKASPAWVLR